MYKLNSLILGVYNYYSIATHVRADFSEIENDLYKFIRYKWTRVTTSRGNQVILIKSFRGLYE